MSAQEVIWTNCVVGRCDGVRAPDLDRCFAHLSEHELGSAIARLGPGAHIDARGTVITSSLLDRILAAVRDPDTNRPVMGHVQFNGAHFPDGADLMGVRFGSDAGFARALFGQEASFDGAEFGRGAWFHDAEFEHGVSFAGAHISGPAGFGEVRVTGVARFDDARFGKQAWFDEARFGGDATFGGAHFDGPAWFMGTDFAEGAGFDGARFDAGVTMSLSAGQLKATGATFGAPSAVGSLSGERVSVQTIERADATNLTLTDVDLTACRFDGVHHLDTLKMEGICTFGRPPRGARLGALLPPLWWWTRRRVLAEEDRWRTTTRRSSGWGATSLSSQALSADRISVLYRQLRKGAEDAKNEPGAADFYYGEMEMRRHGRSTSASERVVLALYWLVSGYGLRALRAVGCLLALVVLGGIGLHLWGFADATWGFPRSLLYAARASVSLEPTSNIELTGWGEALQLVLRLSGPLFLGLALLAVRNRVKR